ncbi:AzlC family ABC transporter permease [Sulfitobacter mediterraneus]|jgi:branched chain amino acid efflux pump|uniref:AzlC family ABC transporter permease n=1 Tax=Sulfitobacter mediterraneus TaxID=83219 RepID=UPI00193179C0|nr:AzlC family ABC transporter permease [Sulfitobacter mediterraneus]MBM1633654.1 AzlC family ABC transporter permease [Sulfitobacter mediterraneus]MBM1641831.1 AzlC family ABC transporter permease [Sulfitobacter mediterraneus]MBM1645518.1 AzlC family ABC transporter permease [Sulfitobacter mediterraneus]MBM1649950.1 AzlC family ABC transporter permease [Sulfitobacter mediterraneus]MBM1653587.1 AzlC family ABC transporter permease [Sulfitobacter mediterraneus]
MATTTAKSTYLKGIFDSSPFILVIIPFASLFGLVATEAGLSVVETLTFSIVVIAGAAQFTALQLMQEQAPTLVVIISSLAVNLRMAMYSAALTPYIGAAPLWQRALAAYLTVDQSYVVSVAEYERRPDMSIALRMVYFFGVVTPIVPLWYGFTFIGAYLGAWFPDGWALDFAIPITFLAMIAPMFRTLAHVVAALVAVAVSLLAAGIPYSLGLMVAGIVGMMAGAQAELWQERKRGRAE